MNNSEIAAQIHALSESRRSIDHAIEALAALQSCDICGGKEGVARRPIMGTKEPVCSVCFGLWYERGIVEGNQLREASLIAQGRTTQGPQSTAEGER